MRSKVQKRGNSLALRIPSAFARALRLEPRREVDAADGGLFVAMADGNPYTLASLLARVTPDRIPGEAPTGTRIGNEAW